MRKFKIWGTAILTILVVVAGMWLMNLKIVFLPPQMWFGKVIGGGGAVALNLGIAVVASSDTLTLFSERPWGTYSADCSGIISHIGMRTKRSSGLIGLVVGTSTVRLEIPYTILQTTTISKQWLLARINSRQVLYLPILASQNFSGNLPDKLSLSPVGYTAVEYTGGYYDTYPYDSRLAVIASSLDSASLTLVTVEVEAKVLTIKRWTPASGSLFHLTLIPIRAIGAIERQATLTHSLPTVEWAEMDGGTIIYHMRGESHSTKRVTSVKLTEDIKLGQGIKKVSLTADILAPPSSARSIPIIVTTGRTTEEITEKVKTCLSYPPGAYILINTESGIECKPPGILEQQ